MGWKAYRLVYQAKSPIHIGWHTLGYIKLTRYYITGKAMWGTFTANLTRAGEEKNTKAYQKYGELFKTDVLLSYFYPALDPDIPLLPKFSADGLKYGGCTEADFERLFIKSYGQTAVLPDSNTAEDESLHESEFIAPCVGEEQSPVCFVGYIFIKDGARTKDNESVGWDSGDIQLKGALSEIFIGGDRKYGWGRLTLINKTETADMFGLNIDNFPKIQILAGAPIPAHLTLNTSVNLRGNIEPLVGREWDNKGAGQLIKSANSGAYWMPGSVLTEGVDLMIDKFGLLKNM